jgi:3-methyladenine DNA glycosylase AlkC
MRKSFHEEMDHYMAEPLKHMYTPLFFEQFAAKIKAVYPAFNSDKFMALVYDGHWDERELKQRIRHITVCLGQTLPLSYEDALAVLRSISDSCRGFPYLFFPDFVEVYGLKHYDLSIAHLELFTSCSSSEFAVRPFIIRYPEKMMPQMLQWTGHPDPHVRRLASEGCRPRLPWSMALTDFKADPSPILPILAALRADESEYVRKSVANNLNDITKDHPLLILQIAQEWFGQNPNTDWILKHACRTLLKQGRPEALVLFGFEKLSGIEVKDLRLDQTEISMGQDLIFTFTVCDSSSSAQKIRLEYGIDFVKANGSRTCKVFKISEKVMDGSRMEITKRHKWREITTRTHYAGEHRLSIRMNGIEMAEALFNLAL